MTQTPNPPPADTHGAEGAAPASPAPVWHPPRRNLLVVIIVSLLAVIVIACILAAFDLAPLGERGVRTDDAYMQGHVMIVAPEVPGYIEGVFVTDYAKVQKGQLLVQIDESTYKARVAQAQADLGSKQAALSNNRQNQASARARLDQRQAALMTAQAHLTRSSADHRRQAALVSDQSVSRKEYDAGLDSWHSDEASLRQALADVRAAEADVKSADVQEQVLSADVRQAEAGLLSAQIDLNRTHIHAESDGVIGRTGGTHIGAYVGAGTALFSLVPNERWVVAEYKEAQTGNIRVGQTASFTVDGLNGQKFTGRVFRIAPATGSEFAVVKPDNATGNFVKIPQRIGIYIAIDPNQQCRAPRAGHVGRELCCDAWRRKP
ncbi:HlyD family secretion protein [Asaia platycodi]|uniref:HlyD family secretion protein n=1 Tax=Asaia platycodi TaxID=610243 RepID=UPI0006844E5B|nr:HlyD family secretion protein [Asaia platycodi]